MAMCAVGMAEEYRGRIGFNNLWPRTSIATAAVKMLAGNIGMNASRNVDIMSDAAHWILTQDAKNCTGNFFIDEDLLRESGVTDFENYSVVAGAELFPDFFI